MKVLTKIFCSLASLLAFDGVAQDLQFSQINLTPIHSNPANTGLDNDFRAIATYRNQWAKVSNAPYRSMMAAYDMSFLRDREGSFGGGIYAYQDVAGDSQMNNTNLILSIAYHQTINESNTISVGFNGGMIQYSVNSKNIQWGSQYNGKAYDPTMPSLEFDRDILHYHITLGTGVNWRFKKEYNSFKGKKYFNIVSGFSIGNVARPDLSTSLFSNVSNKFLRFTYQSSGVIDFMNRDIKLLPMALFTHQGPHYQYMVGTQALYKFNKTYSYYDQENARLALGGGVMFRSNDSFVVSAIMEFKNYMIGLSYDSHIFDIRADKGSASAFEINLRYARLKDNGPLGRGVKYRK